MMGIYGMNNACHFITIKHFTFIPKKKLFSFVPLSLARSVTRVIA